MKARIGFVSNSSSSSYLIWCKGELTRERLLEALGAPSDGIMRKLAEDIADFVLANICDIDWLDEIDDEDYMYTKYVSASYNEGGGVELLLGNSNILHYRSSDLVIERGY